MVNTDVERFHSCYPGLHCQKGGGSSGLQKENGGTDGVSLVRIAMTLTRRSEWEKGVLSWQDIG